MSTLLSELTGGDRRSIGRSNSVVRNLLRDPARFKEIIAGLSHDDPLVRMRCADVAEKVSLKHPEWLRPHKRKLLQLAARSCEKEMRWHLAQMVPRLKLDRDQRRRAEAIMLLYLDDRSRIVKTFAMQALFDLAVDDKARRQRLVPLFNDLARAGGPAMRARARKLIRALTP
jgi:hypothetical protein